MTIQTATGTAECPECFGNVELSDVMQHEIVQCPDCGTDLEVTSIEPLAVETAPEEEEDWGE